MDSFFDLATELAVVRTADDVLSALALPCDELCAMAERARARTLAEHTGERRAAEFLAYCEEARSQRARTTEVMA